MRSDRFFLTLTLSLLLAALGWTGALAQKTTEGTLSDSTPAADLPSDFAVEWMQLIYDRVREDAISAPAASRLYAYAGATLYESILPGMPDNFTLFGQVNGFPTVPYPAQEDGVFDWISVANGALSTVMTGLFEERGEASPQAFADMRALWADRRTGDVTPDVIERSLAYGDEVGAVILAWALSDGYVETRGRPFEPPVGPEYWVPTAAEAQSVEPYWGELRTFTLSFAQECDIYIDYEFSTDPESPFYAQAMEVYEVGQNLTEEQMEIARFWVDTPGETGTPSGHWVLIQNELTDVLGMSLNRAAEMYVKTNAALADSFIATWALKYLYPLLRPETYITEYIDPRWSPYIASPNFPEYPSGHSTTSAAGAEVLQLMFGQVAFTSVNFPGGERMQRSFTSFQAAASEAAISRLYGGIHYRAAIENGMDMGECIGRAAFNRITLRSLPQGE
ncbi:MAG: vanadium-dependent haloperoxidase [Chloroflexota bacterium]|nr:vanadium-dependent haloperoxidase [Chloroflexota bacterium]